MTVTPAPDVTDRTDATDEEFAARIAGFDGEAAPESFDATAALRRVEALADVWDRIADVWQENADHPNARSETRSVALIERTDFRDRARVLRAALAPQTADAEGTGR